MAGRKPRRRASRCRLSTRISRSSPCLASSPPRWRRSPGRALTYVPTPPASAPGAPGSQAIQAGKRSGWPGPRTRKIPAAASARLPSTRLLRWQRLRNLSSIACRKAQPPPNSPARPGDCRSPTSAPSCATSRTLRRWRACSTWSSRSIPPWPTSPERWDCRPGWCSRIRRIGNITCAEATIPGTRPCDFSGNRARATGPRSSTRWPKRCEGGRRNIARMDLEKTMPLKPDAKPETPASKPAKGDTAPLKPGSAAAKPAAPRIEPTLKAEPGTFKPETAADAWIGLLASRGVDYLFANGGTDFAPVVEAYAKGQKLGWKLPQVVIVPHENMGVAMAHGYTMITGRPQAMMVHVGVGTANSMNGLINASRQNVPILFSAGRTPLTESGALPAPRNNYIHWAQEHFDQGGMLREFMKWDYELRHPEQVETVLDRALAIAKSEPQRPVYVTLPREILAAAFTTDTAKTTTTIATASPPAPDLN